jgi:hypothetical protein
MHAAFAADAVDGHDVRILQARRGAGFVLEALQLAGIHGRGEGQDFERDAAAERDLLGFVDNPYAAATNFADYAKVA